MDNIITKDMTIHRALQLKPEAAEVLFSMGMHCLGCAMSRGETIEEAALVHGVNPDELLTKLNDA